MSVARRPTASQAELPENPILGLRSRAVAAAALFAARKAGFVEATKPLLQYAWDHGVTHHLGWDAVECIIYAPFGLPPTSKRRH